MRAVAYLLSVLPQLMSECLPPLLRFPEDAARKKLRARGSPRGALLQLVATGNYLNDDWPWTALDSRKP